MATSQMSDLVAILNTAAFSRERSGATDGQLLQDYVCRRDQSALTVLVRRHGAMVWGVCRRILRSPHDAEDAFQATFLVLVRKAASIAARDLVAHWLYRVAYQIARKARATTAKRTERERQVFDMPDVEADSTELWHDLQPWLDQELNRLPDKYRIPIVLCELEGKTRKEAARQLRCPEGTVAGRLARARSLLARRLARHGLQVSGVVLAEYFAHNTALATLPLSVSSSTIKAAHLFAAGQAAAGGALSTQAVALAEGVLKAMLLCKLKTAPVVLAAIVLFGGGVAALSQHQRSEKPTVQVKAPVLADKPTARSAPTLREPSAQTAVDKKETEPLPHIVRGVAKTVDATNHQLTVAEAAVETTFTVAADAQILVDDKPTPLAALPVGANVLLSQFADSATTRHVQAGGRWFFGDPVRRVDPQGRSITIENKREGAQTFNVAQDACITVDGQHCDLAAVPVGALVNLGLAADQQTARSIGAEGEHLGDCGGSMVKAVNPSDNTITFDDKAHPNVAGKTFRISPNVFITIDGKGGKLLYDLPPGSYANITLTVDQQLVRQINAQGPPVDCDCHGSAIQSVDSVNSTITFNDKARPTIAGKTFPVAKDALLMVDGRGGSLAEISPGALITARFRVDKTTIGTINANGPALTGVITAVDAAGRSITVDRATYPVAKDALVVIDGKQCPLAAMPTDANVRVNLRVDGKTVGMIQLQRQ